MATDLSMRGVNAGYGAARVLHDLDLDIERGETLAVLGRNGVGKTTLVETLVGLTSLHSGRIDLHGQRVEQLAPHRRSRLGLGWVPQSREVFTSLTVEENLTVVARPGHWTLARVYQLFPRLQERRTNRGNQLSGGEQQMLAIGRSLMTNPTLLLLDEPVEGLAPVVVMLLMQAMVTMRAQGDLTLMLVEQKHDIALDHSDRCIVLDHGAIAWQGASSVLRNDPGTLERLLAVGH